MAGNCLCSLKKNLTLFLFLKFHSYAEDVGPEGEDIRYTLFPRDPSSDILMGKKTSIVHFPLAHIEQSINEGVGSEMLMEALRDALQYVKVSIKIFFGHNLICTRNFELIFLIIFCFKGELFLRFVMHNKKQLVQVNI